MVKKYVVVLKVNTTKDLATLFGAIDEFAEVVSTSMEETKEKPRAVAFATPTAKKVRVPGQSGRSLVLSQLPCSLEKLMRVFVEKGYKPVSLSPALSTLKKDGKIIEREGVWYKK